MSINILHLQPLFNNVLVELLEPEKETPDGIVRPDSIKDEFQQGKVIAIGNGSTKTCQNNCDLCKDISMKVTPRQKVLFKIKFADKVQDNYYMINQSDLTAVIK